MQSNLCQKPQANRITVCELSPKAQQRLHLIWSVDNLKAEGLSVEKAAGCLGIARSTYYRWQRQLKSKGPRGLEDRSRRPKSPRKPAWEPGLILAVKDLREQHPGWGKAKLAPILRDQGFSVSESTVGRILRYLKRRGQLIEPPRNGVKARRRRLKRPHAERKPKDYQPERPGDLIQLDTLDVKLTSWFGFKHFTAQDTVSRWNVVAAYPSASAKNARDFLEKLIERTPFEVKAIQVDGGRAGFAGAAGGGWPSLRLPVRNWASGCLCCRPVRPSLTARLSVPTAATSRSSTTTTRANSPLRP